MLMRLPQRAPQRSGNGMDWLSYASDSVHGKVFAMLLGQACRAVVALQDTARVDLTSGPDCRSTISDCTSVDGNPLGWHVDQQFSLTYMYIYPRPANCLSNGVISDDESTYTTSSTSTSSNGKIQLYLLLNHCIGQAKWPSQTLTSTRTPRAPRLRL